MIMGAFPAQYFCMIVFVLYAETPQTSQTLQGYTLVQQTMFVLMFSNFRTVKIKRPTYQASKEITAWQNKFGVAGEQSPYK